MFTFLSPANRQRRQLLKALANPAADEIALKTLRDHLFNQADEIPTGYLWKVLHRAEKLQPPSLDGQTATLIRDIRYASERLLANRCRAS